MKLKESGIEFKTKVFLTYGDVKRYEEIMFDGVETKENGTLDQGTMLKNVKKQAEELILISVNLFGGKKEITREDLLGMHINDYKQLLKECEKLINDKKKA